MNMHDYDEACAMIAETYPPLWKRLYDNLILVGFNEVQAERLLIAFIQRPVGEKS